MPQFIRAAGYKIYFWSNENDTKFWLLENGSIKLAHNKGHISEKDLSKIMSIMQLYYSEFVDFWKTYFGGTVKFYK